MDTEIATVLPRELRLGVPPTMPQARTYLFRQQSTDRAYAPGRTIQINIPRLQRSYLRKDSYLRFTVDVLQAKDANNDIHVSLDTAGAYGFFDKIEIFDYLGSTVLESIQGAAQLSALLLDLGLDEIIDGTVGNASAGLTNAIVNSQTAVKNNLDYIYEGGRVQPPTSGIKLQKGATATIGGVDYQAFTVEFAIPLLSFLGLLSKKMVPLHNGFSIVLTLANTNVPMFQWRNQNFATKPLGGADADKDAEYRADLLLPLTTPATMSWTVRDVNMECQILELGPVAESMLLSTTQGQPLILHTKSFRNYVGHVKGATWTGAQPNGVLTTTGQSEFTLNLNLNVASLTNILWFMRPSDQVDSAVQMCLGNRVRNYLQRWSFQYGSTTLPQNNGIETMSTVVPSYVTSLATDDRVAGTYWAQKRGCSEGYRELIKARSSRLTHSRIMLQSYMQDTSFGKVGDPSVTGGYFNQLSAIGPNAYGDVGPGRFAAGLNLELVNGKQGEVICGLNTNGMTTTIRGTFHPSYTDHMDSVVVDAYAEYDAFINISPGIATTLSF